MIKIMASYLIASLLLTAACFTPSGRMATDVLHSWGILAWVGVFYVAYTMLTIVVYLLIFWLDCLWQERKHGRNKAR